MQAEVIAASYTYDDYLKLNDDKTKRIDFSTAGIRCPANQVYQDNN